MTHFVRQCPKAVLFVVLSLALGHASIVQAQKSRAPIPAKADQAKSLKLVREIFAEDWAAAKSPKQKTELAHKLLQQAAESRQGSADQYILLRVARDLAILAGDARTTSSAIKKMSTAFQVQRVSLQVAAGQKLQTKARTLDQRKTLGKVATDWADEALADDDHETATVLLDTALAMARKTRNSKLAQKLAARQKEITSTAKAFTATKAALKKLRDAPTDRAANLTAGRYYCLVKDDWKTGIPYLAAGGDSELSQLARRELAVKPGGQDTLGLADAWWALSNQEKGSAKMALMTHAGSWYEKALPQQRGLARVRTEKRLAELAKITGALQPKEPQLSAKPVPKLLRKRPTKAPKTKTANIWDATIKGDVNGVRQHLAAGADVNAREPKGGSTALLLAALHGHTEVAALLIEKGAELSSKNNDGFTPLHVASFFAHAKTVELLVKKGADINARGRRGETPLDTVAPPWSVQLEVLYRVVGGAARVKVDIARIKATRPKVAEILRKAKNPGS
jgi:hypothetical protein